MMEQTKQRLQIWTASLWDCIKTILPEAPLQIRPSTAFPHYYAKGVVLKVLHPYSCYNSKIFTFISNQSVFHLPVPMSMYQYKINDHMMRQSWGLISTQLQCKLNIERGCLKISPWGVSRGYRVALPIQLVWAHHNHLQQENTHYLNL